MPRHERMALVLGVAAALATTSLLVALPLLLAPAHHPSPTGPASQVKVTDVTGVLGGLFRPGIPLALGSNDSVTYLGGIGIYNTSTGFSLPVFGSLSVVGGTPTVANLTSEVNGEFLDGGVYAIGWNGTTWLVAGQGLPDPNAVGRMVSIHAGVVTDLDSLVLPYFVGGGIWSIGWNGTDWLIGGNSTAGVSLISYDGTKVTDLSSILRDHLANGWIQLLAWNGGEWLVGGAGILELLHGGSATDLLPGSPFAGSGAYAAGWNGTSWIVGGGGGAKLEIITGSSTAAGPALPAGFDQVVLMVAPTSVGWIFAGKGTASTGGFAPELSLWPSGGGGVVDLTSEIPAAFAGGEIQGGAPAPELGLGVILLAGEGRYNPATGLGFGAAAELTVA